MRILIAGNDAVALTVAEALMTAHQVVLIAPAAWAIARLEQLDVEVVRGQASAPEVLQRAGIANCRVFIACTTNDERNIVACLSARTKGARQTICMLGQPGFFDAEGSNDDIAQALGVDLVIRPWDRLARELLQIATMPGALDVALLARRRVALLRYAVEEDAPITHYPIKQYPLPEGVTLVGLRRGEQISIPGGDTHLRAGDKLTVMGRPEAVAQLLSHLRAPTAHNDRRKATIVGGGVVGYLVARGLEDAGWHIKLIETNHGRCEEIAPLLPRALVLHGDGSDIDLLEEEQVSEAPVLIAVTDNDEKNLLISMLAKTLGVERIITRASRLSNERLFERVGIDVVRSARGAAVRSIVQNALDARQEIRAELEHGDVHVLELELPSDFPPTALRAISTDLRAIVGVVLRGEEVVLPRGPTVLLPGDHLFVFCHQDDEEKSRMLVQQLRTAERID